MIGIYTGGSVAFVLCIVGIVYILCRKTHVHSLDNSTKSGSVSLITGVPSRTNQTASTMTGTITKTEPNYSTPGAVDIDVSVLPTDWVEMHTSDATVYYQNNVTHQTRWDKPTAAPSIAAEKPSNPNDTVITVISVQSCAQAAPAPAIASDVANHKPIYPVLPNQTSIDVNTKPNDPVVQLNQEDALPSDWVQLYTRDNRMYYQNNVTKQTQWTMPSHSQVVIASASTVATSGESTDDGVPNAAAEYPTAPSAPVEEEGATSGYINSDKEDDCVSNDAQYSDVKQFFEGISVLEEEVKLKYFKLFILNGFDGLEIVQTVSHQDLLDIGVIKLGHRKMILSKAQQL
eukprot:387174_1